jgi:hypothetical protein
MSMALTGNNGDNETNIQSSKSIDFSIHDENGKEISVNNQVKPIEFWIAKDSTKSIEPFVLINSTISNQTNQTNQTNNFNSGFIQNGFKLSSMSNVSIHIQIKPLNYSEFNNNNKGYLSLLKFGSNPSLTTPFDYDLVNVLCPSDILYDKLNNDSFYLIFANISKINGFKGYVGFSLKEFNSTKYNCTNKTSINLGDLILDQSIMIQSYWLRIFTAGCYFMNTITNDWSSYGTEVLSDTNVTHTHCQSNHLTSFAGGFITLPSAIDFNDVFARASFLDNPVIYSTVIALICLYILLAIWARYMDWKDEKKMGITVLGDLKDKKNAYIYEIIIFTGNRLNAGTKSKV